jgi:L-asparagine oxygenase
MPRWLPAPPARVKDLTDLAVQAEQAAISAPPSLRTEVVRFRHGHTRSGALLLSGAPIGHVPETPQSPTFESCGDRTSEFTLLTVAALLGHAIGYRPEHGGDIVQNIVPTRRGASAQISTSSRVDLLLHTETAFHPHRPRYLLLLCRRGDPAAGTTLAVAADLVNHLAPNTVDVLFEPRFRTAVDASFLDGRASPRGRRHAVLTGDRRAPTMVFDADLTVGADPEAHGAVRELEMATSRHHTTVVLEPGDLLVIDNHRAVHGRTSFTPRFDGRDRWLQRAFVITDLDASAAERVGRVITTEFTTAAG